MGGGLESDGEGRTRGWGREGGGGGEVRRRQRGAMETTRWAGAVERMKEAP